LNGLKPVAALGAAEYSLGDDAAVIRNGSEYLLLAAEEINRSLLAADPWWAGFCAVLTNVNDIYAMGGVPVALVNTLSFKDAETGARIVQGMADACKKYGVPMVGGHYTPEGECPTLSAAILGKATTVLSSFNAREEDILIAAVELTGRQYKDLPNWDCISDKTAEQIRDKLSVMPELAGKGIVHAAKDISNGGIMGTVCMLVESSHCGAKVALDRIPVPEGIEVTAWLKMYPSYGFILSVPPDAESTVMEAFRSRRYAAAPIGRVTAAGKVVVQYGEEEALFMDLSRESMFG